MCVECTTPRNLCMTCDSPNCKNTFCNEHRYTYESKQLCFLCFSLATAVRFVKFTRREVQAMRVLHLAGVPN